MARCVFRFWWVPSSRRSTHDRRSFCQHAPGEDQYGYEDAGERWLPVHTVETIVRPVADVYIPHLICDCNDSSSVSFRSSRRTPRTPIALPTWMQPRRSELILLVSFLFELIPDLDHNWCRVQEESATASSQICGGGIRVIPSVLCHVMSYIASSIHCHLCTVVVYRSIHVSWFLSWSSFFT